MNKLSSSTDVPKGAVEIMANAIQAAVSMLNHPSHFFALP
ncbi:hypothetical protein Poly30_48860 [Planctomycetes bacterium Poly30]|uniref:Uncharacterized protein n=1 Tax=Saltatorellus ferox TaxID=2528018 RepID=A0A518EZ22_9BACT|nr:hypothetical protein Poly30_48860 [Planctomycetes bacterium Poly30]